MIYRFDPESNHVDCPVYKTYLSVLWELGHPLAEQLNYAISLQANMSGKFYTQQFLNPKVLPFIGKLLELEPCNLEHIVIDSYERFIRLGGSFLECIKASLKEHYADIVQHYKHCLLTTKNFIWNEFTLDSAMQHKFTLKDYELSKSEEFKDFEKSEYKLQ
ncbi:hypothetical protein AB4163_19930 [Vibrio splendidus]